MRNHIFIISFILFASLALALTGCGGSNNSEPTDDTSQMSTPDNNTSNNTANGESTTGDSDSGETSSDGEEPNSSDSQAESSDDSTSGNQSDSDETASNNANSGNASNVSTPQETRPEFRTDRVENDYFVYERTVPTVAEVGVPYTISIRIEAKQDLQLVAYSEEQNPVTVLNNGQLQNLSTGLSAGAIFEDEYQLTFTSDAGTAVTLRGAARTPVSDDNQDAGRLELTSQIEIMQ